MYKSLYTQKAQALNTKEDIVERINIMLEKQEIAADTSDFLKSLLKKAYIIIMINFTRAHPESLEKTTFLYRNRTLVFDSFGTPKRAGMHRI